MNKKLLIFFIFCILVFSCTTKSNNEENDQIGMATTTDDKQAFMVYGQDFMVTVPLENKWMVNMDFAFQHNINGFWYLEEYGIENSPTAIILELATKPEPNTPIADYINWDKEGLLDYYTEAIWEDSVDEIRSEHEYAIKLINFYTIGGHYQIIAYIECDEKYFLKLYLDTKNKEDFEKYKPDFLSGIEELTYMNIKLKK